MTEPVAFFCRAKPQGADAFPIFKQAERVFIGYPLLKKEANYDPHGFKHCLVSPMADEEEWTKELKGRGRTNSFTRNRNFCNAVTEGSIVVIPRPERGSAYIAKISGSFEIVNNPEWAADYLALRKEQYVDVDDEKNRHIADVVQGWPIDEYREISLARIPGWLRKSMLGRSAFGYLGAHPLDDSITAHGYFNDLTEGKSQPDTSWTTDIEIIKQRLVDYLSPTSFEHLVVNLLQLEYPEEIWQQSGGPGDGGIDGFGCNEKGETTAILQCKYSHHGTCELARKDNNPLIRRYFAVLLPEKHDAPTDGTILLDLDWSAKKLLEHYQRLPMAVSLRVGHR